jgi:pimeloyl-ACP methyl ester carboxylesterase
VALAAARFSCADALLYSYTGGTVDASGTWHPAPYSCYDTGNHVATSVGKLVTLMTAYRSAHPDAQFVLIGHSLGGLLALDASAQMPAGAVSSVVTIDSPLKGVSRRNLKQFTQLVQPFIAFAGCSKVLWDSDAARDIATVHNRKTRQKASQAAGAIVHGGQKVGIRYMTVGNASDCLWKPAACKIRGKWSDDSSTMTIKPADNHTLYPLGTGGCNLSNVINKKGVVQLRNVPEVTCIATSHGLALQTPGVIQDIVRFVGPGSS